MSLSPEQQKKMLYAALAVLALAGAVPGAERREAPYRAAHLRRAAPSRYRGSGPAIAVPSACERPAAAVPGAPVWSGSPEFHVTSSGWTTRRRRSPDRRSLLRPTPTIIVPVIPEKTPEQLAAEAAQADLSKFRFLGYLTDKESSLFLAKDGETFIVRSGDYRAQELPGEGGGQGFRGPARRCHPG